MEFGAEGDLEEAVDDFGVGEGLALDRAAMGDLGVLGRRRAPRRPAAVSVTSSTPQFAGQCRAIARGAIGASRTSWCRALMPAPRGRIMAWIADGAMPGDD